MSLSWAEFVSTLSNWTLLGALIVGVVATYGIVVSSNVKETASKVRVALLESDANAAKLETERLKKELGWREVSPEQAAKLKAFLRARPMGVSVWWNAGDAEGAYFANNLSRALVNAGLTIRGGGSMVHIGAAAGAEVHGIQVGGSLKTEIDALANALGEAGFSEVTKNERDIGGNPTVTSIMVGYRAALVFK